MEVPDGVFIGDQVPLERSRPGVFQAWTVRRAVAGSPDISVSRGDLEKPVTREGTQRLRRLAAIGALPPEPSDSEIFGLHPPKDMLEWGARLSALVASVVPPEASGRDLDASKGELEVVPYRAGQRVAVQGEGGIQDGWMITAVHQDADGQLFASVEDETAAANGQQAAAGKLVPLAELTFYQYKQQMSDDYERVVAGRG